MADYDLQQTDAQVQAILNDGQSAMGAGAQTALTTEYVMLKDVNGVYHKILKNSLTEACRNVLASLLVNNDKGTTISQLPAIASGDFGSVTPANLASVLGAFRYGGILDLQSNIKTLESGFYMVPKTSLGGVPAGIPVDMDGFIFVFPSAVAAARTYYYIASNATHYTGCQWWNENIVWRQTTQTIL